MKRIFSIAITIALLLGAASCTELLDPSLRQAEQQVPENAKVTLYFGIPGEVATKADAAMDSLPKINSIHVFVFNKEGILVETAEAKNENGNTFGPVTTNGPDGAKWWSVILTMSGSERRLHFIANLPKENGKYVIPEAGSEASIFQSLATTYPEAAYWQRRVLSYGIRAYQYDGTKKYKIVNSQGIIVNLDVPSTEFDGEDGNWSYKDRDGNWVNKGDYIDRDGKKIVTGSGFYAIEEIVEKIPMIRNFACIRVKSTWTRTVGSTTQTFELTQAALINRPVAGYVAPYNPNQSVTGDFAQYNRFVPEYIDITGDVRPQESNLTGYSGSVPAAGIYTGEPEATDFKTEKDREDYIRLFMYERNIPTSKPTSLLIAGKWGGTGPDVWYKIELTSEGKYFKILRDFTYDVIITGIEGNDGYNSWQKAFTAGAVGDISSSPETAALEQISDDKNLTLWVSYIDKAIINTEIPDDEDDPDRCVSLLYTCFKGDDYFNDDSHISFTRQKHPDYPDLPYATTGADADDPEIPEIVDGPRPVATTDEVDLPDDNLEWYIVKFRLNKIQEGQGYLRSQIHVEANVTSTDVGYDKTLSRNVTYTVMPKLRFTSLSASAVTNGQTTLTIELPTTLTPSLFPLDLVIEDENNCLMPVSGEPVESGKSSFEGKGNSFYFVKDIAYSDYYNVQTQTIKQNVFTVVLKTTKDLPSGGTTIKITDKRGYFVPGEVTVN